MFDLACDLFAEESRGFPEVGQQVAGHEFSAAAADMVFVRRFVGDEVGVHECCSLVVDALFSIGVTARQGVKLALLFEKIFNYFSRG